MAKDKKYMIKYTTYSKHPTGNKDGYGRNQFETKGVSRGAYENTDWKSFKQDLYKKSKNNKELFVNWGDRFDVRRKRVVKSVTKKFADGHKEVTYFG